MTESEIPDASVRGSRVLRRLAPLLVMLVVLVGAAWLVARNWSGLSAALTKVGWPVMIGSALLAIAGTACVERVWARLLVGSGQQVDTRAAASVFFVSQFGKYLPGSLWPVVAQAEFGRRSGIGRRIMLAANILMLAVVAATGLLTGAALLPWSSADGLRRYWWAYLFLPPLVAALHPRAIPAALDALLRLIKRKPLELRVRSSEIVRACAWGFATWLFLGLHLYLMTRAVGASGVTGLTAAVGGMAFAFAAGLLFPLAPAGAGVRDAVLVLTLSPQIGSTNALAVALSSRVLMVIADVLLAAAGAVVGRRTNVQGMATQAGSSP